MPLYTKVMPNQLFIQDNENSCGTTEIYVVI